MQVGIRELKRRLSAWVERAAKGEVIRVTDRGKPRAVLGPLSDADRIAVGIAEGWIRPARSRRTRRTPQRHRPARPSAEVLAEDRGE